MADGGFARLTSPRLILRRLRESDLPAPCAYRSDPLVARYQDWDSWSADDARLLLAAQRALHPDVPGTWFQMAIESAETGALIGDCGLHTLADRPGQAEIGFTLAGERQGRGYATEAVDRLFVQRVHRDLRRPDDAGERAGQADRVPRAVAVFERPLVAPMVLPAGKFMQPLVQCAPQGDIQLLEAAAQDGPAESPMEELLRHMVAALDRLTVAQDRTGREMGRLGQRMAAAIIRGAGAPAEGQE